MRIPRFSGSRAPGDSNRSRERSETRLPTARPPARLPAAASDLVSEGWSFESLPRQAAAPGCPPPHWPDMDPSCGRLRPAARLPIGLTWTPPAAGRCAQLPASPLARHGRSLTVDVRGRHIRRHMDRHIRRHTRRHMGRHIRRHMGGLHCRLRSGAGGRGRGKAGVLGKPTGERSHRKGNPQVSEVTVIDVSLHNAAPCRVRLACWGDPQASVACWGNSQASLNTVTYGGWRVGGTRR